MLVEVALASAEAVLIVIYAVAVSIYPRLAGPRARIDVGIVVIAILTGVPPVVIVVNDDAGHTFRTLKGAKQASILIDIIVAYILLYRLLQKLSGVVLTIDIHT